MITTLLASAALAAAAPAWTPAPTFTLTCTGTQSAYTDDNGVKQTLPWSQTFKVDLVKGTYCTQGCAQAFPLKAVSADTFDLDNVASGPNPTLRRYHPASGQFESNVITSAGPSQRFHLEQSGTCSLAKTTAP